MHYLEFDYRITIFPMNCMYSDFPKFINFEKECADIEEFLTKNYSAHILAIYSIFQGATVMTELLARCGYKQSSLSVQKQNYAVGMYKKVGFQIIDENEEEYIMVCKL